MDEREGRLIERYRRWERVVPPFPPVAETRAAVAERLAATRAAVLAAIERQRDDTIALLRTMVRIPSANPSEGFEQEMAAFTARELRGLGLATTEIETAPRRGKAQIVAVADEEMGGHLGIAQLIDIATTKIYALTALLLLH